jgi:hypothetical protein
MLFSYVGRDHDNTTCIVSLYWALHHMSGSGLNHLDLRHSQGFGHFGMVGPAQIPIESFGRWEHSV